MNDIEAARKNLIGRGAKVSEVFQYAGGPFNNTGKNPRVCGRDPQGRSYFSFASFEDPDGNGYLLQEIKRCLPGREMVIGASGKDRHRNTCRTPSRHRAASRQLRRTEKHYWWEWYAPYLSARLIGRSPEEAAAAADRYMEMK